MTPKVLGTETEYGITVRGVERFNPALASALVVAVLADPDSATWLASLIDESSGEEWGGEALIPDGIAVNTVLPNGARFYVDHAHPEYATPEALSPLGAVLYDRAGDETLRRAAEAASNSLSDGRSIGIYKNNSDGKGNSYGYHENVLLSRSLPFAEVVRTLPTFLVSRQVIGGAGKVGAENGRSPAAFQISQRADFFEELVGLETTLRRPIVNTRDEPHAGPDFRRLHVIHGDATMSDVQTLVKLGSLAWFLAALEAGALADLPRLAAPIQAGLTVSRDLQLTARLPLVGGGTSTALELQRTIFDRLVAFGQPPRLVPDRWGQLLDDLQTDRDSTADRLDWVAKLQLLNGFAGRGVAWNDAKMRTIDLQYSDIDRKRSLHSRLVDAGRMERLFTDAEVSAAVDQPPSDTRAWLRGYCIQHFGANILTANWDNLVFQLPNGELSRVPMMTPHGSTKSELEARVIGASNVTELVAALGGDHG